MFEELFAKAKDDIQNYAAQMNRIVFWREAIQIPLAVKNATLDHQTETQLLSLQSALGEKESERQTLEETLINTKKQTGYN